MTTAWRVGSTPVSVLASDAVTTVAPNATLVEVAATLVSGDIGVAVVRDGDHTVGVISERDIVRALARGSDLAATSALEVAQKTIVWCDAGTPAAEVAEDMMERYIRHVLVKKDGKLVGVVSARDLLGAYACADMASPT